MPWAVAAVAVGVGVAIDTLALHQPPGLGLTLGLWVAVLAVASTGVLMDRPRQRATPWLAATALVLSAFVSFRASPVLVALNVGSTLLLVSVISQLHAAGGLGSWTLARFAERPFFLARDSIVGSAGFVRADLRTEVSADDRQRWRAIALGVVLGAPVVAVFATLFASADVSFDAYLDELTTTLSFGSLIERGFLILVIALAAAGVWRTARRPEDRLPETLPDWPGPRIDPRSAITVLTLLVGLFALFVLTQVLGHNPDLVTPQDYSQNARNGFFQLLTVTFLVLTLLLVLDWLTRRPDGGRHRGVDRLALALVALTGVVVVSALSRMRLYVNEFGFTELRIYTTVFMVWLGFVLVWFLITVLRNRHARFAFGVLTSALVVVFGLNVANPDSLIVQFNWDRHVAGAEFAQEYSSTLSADSIPALIQIVEDHPDEQFCFVERRLERERAALAAKRAAHGLLGDSWSQYRARGALSSFDVRSGDGC